jgi:hypothetical protein
VVDAPFAVADAVLDAPFKVAQAAVDTPMKPVTDPMNDARRRHISERHGERRRQQMDEVRARMIAEGRLPAPETGPDGKPVYTRDNYLVPVSPVSSGTATPATVAYKKGAKAPTDKTPVDRPLPPGMGVAVPVPRTRAERSAWKKNGAPAIVQRPAAVHPSQVNIRDANAQPTNAGAPGSGTVTYQPSIGAPTSKPVYRGPGPEPRTDLGATR